MLWIVAARRAGGGLVRNVLGGRRSAASRRELGGRLRIVSAESPARAGLSVVTADLPERIASSGGGAFGQNNPQAPRPRREAATPAAEDVLDERPAPAPPAWHSEKPDPSGSVLPPPRSHFAVLVLRDVVASRRPERVAVLRRPPRLVDLLATPCALAGAAARGGRRRRSDRAERRRDRRTSPRAARSRARSRVAARGAGGGLAQPRGVASSISKATTTRTGTRISRSLRTAGCSISRRRGGERVRVLHGHRFSASELTWAAYDRLGRGLLGAENFVYGRVPALRSLYRFGPGWLGAAVAAVECFVARRRVARARRVAGRRRRRAAARAHPLRAGARAHRRRRHLEDGFLRVARPSAHGRPHARAIATAASSGSAGAAGVGAPSATVAERARRREATQQRQQQRHRGREQRRRPPRRRRSGARDTPSRR